MRLQKLFKDDDAVSPVIGVILMVAITVILAAVIASFVLGLGDQAGNVAPQASLSTEYDSTETNLTITHESGNPIVSDQIRLRGTGFHNATNANTTWANYTAANNATVSGTSDGEPAVTAGDQLVINASSDYEVRVVWESTEGESSDTLLEDSGPDA
jgi:flagellin-like protein